MKEDFGFWFSEKEGNTVLTVEKKGGQNIFRTEGDESETEALKSMICILYDVFVEHQSKNRKIIESACKDYGFSPVILAKEKSSDKFVALYKNDDIIETYDASWSAEESFDIAISKMVKSFIKQQLCK